MGTGEKLLLHVHVYYTEMWASLTECISHIHVPFDMYVTLVQENPEVEALVKRDYPDATVLVVPNRGYDIGPFMEVLNRVSLDDYAYVAKLHSKRDLKVDYRINGMSMRGGRWRRELLRYVESEESFAKAWDYISTHPRVGAVASWRTIVRCNVNKKDRVNADGVIREQGWGPCKYSFVAGTMFLMRAKLLKPLQHRWKIEDFELPTVQDGQLAHTIERILGYLVCREGYLIRDWRKWRCLPLMYLLYSVKDFLFMQKYTGSGRRMLKICKIPVWHSKVRGGIPGTEGK